MIPRRFLLISDAAIVVAAFLLAYIATPHLYSFSLFDQLRIQYGPSGFPVGLPVLAPVSELVWVLLSMGLATLVVLHVLGNYSPILEQSRSRIILGSFASPLAGLSLITLILFALKTPSWSRVFIFLFTFLIGSSLAIYRTLLRFYVAQRRAAGHYARNVLLIGATSGIEWMVRYFHTDVLAGDYRLLGYLHVTETQAPPAEAEHLPNMGAVEELGNLLIHQPIHDVIVVHPVGGGEWVRQVIRDCDYFGVALRIVPEALLFEKQNTIRIFHPLKPLHVPAVILTPPHWNSDALFIKRLLDIFISAGLLLLLIPVFIVIAVAIKLTTPELQILYKWRVVGRNGVEFTGYKFTTMISNADQLKNDLQHRNEMVGPVFKIKDDPRTTKLGRFLRKYSLNELPQLWSVLKGDMSLVGPRPAFRHELERYEFWHKRKLSISPGITCLWQVSGRNNIKHFDEWVRMDLEYIDNWSLWLDIKILARTFWVVVSGTGS